MTVAKKFMRGYLDMGINFEYDLIVESRDYVDLLFEVYKNGDIPVNNVLVEEVEKLYVPVWNDIKDNYKPLQIMESCDNSINPETKIRNNFCIQNLAKPFKIYKVEENN